MLKLTAKEYDQAAEKMADALADWEAKGIKTCLGRALLMLEALGEDFDVAAMDPGPREDIESGNVWPESDEELATRARENALEAGLMVGHPYPRVRWGIPGKWS
jgi:hypothetical protein